MISRGKATGRYFAVILASLLFVPLTAYSQEAKEVKHWAFQQVKRPEVPRVQNSSWIRTPIDGFVLARLQKNDLQPAPPAEKRTLLRRVYLDLIGLPPTPEEQRAFLEDQSLQAYARVVDDLLARPQFGERWARHWLDVVRFAETNGYERDTAKPYAWRYRDYVIDSFNRDKPYDQFLLEQIAGDEMDYSTAEMKIATTFLRLGTWDDEPADPKIDRYDQLDDVLGTTATAFLGLTLRCARCHDHKFEPFTQEDYYRMLAVFEPLKRPQKGQEELDRFVGTKAELSAYEAAIAKPQAELAALEKKMAESKRNILQRLQTASSNPASLKEGTTQTRVGTGDSQAKVGKKGAAVLADAIGAFLVDPAKRTDQQNALVKKFANRLEREISEASTTEEKAQREVWEKQIADLKKNKPVEPPRAYIWYEEGPQAPVTHIFRRGDPTRPKGDVGPGLPAILVNEQVEPPKPLDKSTGRRLWLARWLTRPDNPLVARVIVNRIWQDHFGEGLVASANDFGVMGQKPSDPELLDWLAGDFVAGGWKMKRLHRMIVLSNTYQMAATNPIGVAGAESSKPRYLEAVRGFAALSPGHPAALSKLEGLSHWKQRRLEAEAVRDSILAVSGRLNPQMGGPSVYPLIPRAVLEGQSRPGEGWGKSSEKQASRRSVYVYVKRVLGVPELELLDTPDTTFSCERRPVSTTGPQALTYLNGDFVQEQAKCFAGRLERDVGADAGAQVRRAFELALCRRPRAEELQASLDFLDKQQQQIEADTEWFSPAQALRPGLGKTSKRRALEAFCLVILNTNEFVYVN
jgi:hypothetical protein